MSLSRTALRLAVIEALAPFALRADPAAVWPTMAGPRVTDSQIEVEARPRPRRASR